MTDIGVEVGQKMRSAIKAKLMELECYVDDELPDYIMVMVANKRTKSQMNEDLQLFLGLKTSTFVEWLHIVLKKLKEVHVTNPNVFKKAVKRKVEDPELEKDVKKEIIELKSKKIKSADIGQDYMKSLTDDLPLNIKLSDIRKVSIENLPMIPNSDNFDIPTISEVNSSNKNTLRMIEKKIKSAKSRLGIVVNSESEEEFLDIKAEPDDLFPNEQSQNKRDKGKDRKVNVLPESLTPPVPSVTPKKNTDSEVPKSNKEHSRITFDLDLSARKKSALNRLGKRRLSHENDRTSQKKSKINISEIRKEEEQLLGIRKERSEKKKSKKSQDAKSRRESALSRLGVMSKVSIPPKKLQEPVDDEDLVPDKEVPSTIKVKPRIIPPNAPQANKNLLLKAVAEARRSIAQTPSVGNNIKPDALFTKKYKEKIAEKSTKRRVPEKQKSKLQDIISHISKNAECMKLNLSPELTEYIPKPIRRAEVAKPMEYIPSAKEVPKVSESESFEPDKKTNFIVTLDGIDKTKFETAVEERVEKKRKTPSPIIFDKVSSPVKKIANVPDLLPRVYTSPLVKNKERCKYWPVCRQGEKCEFVHPATPCKMFPQCKFGDKCLYVHPSCKFESSCTRRDCPYSHVSLPKAVVSRIPPNVPTLQGAKSLQTCKFYPNCTNPHCTYYHQRPCKFGKFCKNQLECTFLHPKSSNLTWRSNLKA